MFNALKWKLYSLAWRYIEKMNAIDPPDYTYRLSKLERLTYRTGDNKAYLKYGVAGAWRKLASYPVIDNAIQKLADYEDVAFNYKLKTATYVNYRPSTVNGCPYSKYVSSADDKLNCFICKHESSISICPGFDKCPYFIYPQEK